MDINRNGFVGRVFLVAHRLTRQFAGDFWWDAPRQTDLCQLLRSIFVGAPLAIAVNLATLAWALYALGYFAFVLWLNASGVGVVLLVCLAAAAIIAVVFAIVYGGVILSKIFNGETAREVGAVITTYYRARKASICPLVDLKEPNNEAA